MISTDERRINPVTLAVLVCSHTGASSREPVVAWVNPSGAAAEANSIALVVTCARSRSRPLASRGGSSRLVVLRR